MIVSISNPMKGKIMIENHDEGWAIKMGIFNINVIMIYGLFFILFNIYVSSLFFFAFATLPCPRRSGPASSSHAHAASPFGAP